jgi:hypothetical protein
LQHIEDKQIKAIVVNALGICKQLVQTIKDIFLQEGFPVPKGFGEEDVNLGAQKLFSDEFYLHLLKYDGKVGLSLYGAAIPLITRSDIQAFFTQCLNSTAQLLNRVNQSLVSKGLIITPAVIPYPKQVDFVEKQSYLSGFLGKIRPLHALEIAHLYNCIEDNTTGKAIAMGFSQVAKSEQVRNYFLKVTEMDAKHYEILSKVLREENFPPPSIIDPLVTTSTSSPFSDKLMVFHKLDLLTMRIRAYGNAMSLCARNDLAVKYGRLTLEVGNCAEDGAKIMIDNRWLEQMPQAPDRDELVLR